MAATEDMLQEDMLQQGAINVRIGEGRTAEVLHNLCLQIYDTDQPGWLALVSRISNLFGVLLQPPEYLKESGQITMSYEEGGIGFDLASSGRGLQKTLLLLAHLYTHPDSVLLLDEPDAHLEILRQRQIYWLLTATAESQRRQIIAASHSEVLLNEAADRDVVVPLPRKPHRIDERGSQLLSGRSFITSPTSLQRPENISSACGMPSRPLCELKWSRREIENYLCYSETLLVFAGHRHRDAMQRAMNEVSAALKLLCRVDAFGPDVKASEEFPGPVFQSYFDELGLPNLMQKTGYHTLVSLVPIELIDPEIAAKLNRLAEVAESATPVS